METIKLVVKSKKTRGVLAFMGVWICFCAIADYVIQFETNSYTMLFGYIAGLISIKAQEWIEE